ncbi:MAG: hypothetical protein V4773_05415, partial [Verrucomicrobiota bacterium]
ESPRWLEAGAVAWCETRTHPAQLDARKYASQSLPPPSLAALFEPAWPQHEWQVRELGALWLLTLLQAETTRAGEWPACLAQLLRGRAGGTVLDETFPGRFESPEERELWWQ